MDMGVDQAGHQHIAVAVDAVFLGKAFDDLAALA
jgi:hypothetical protein